LFVLQTFNTQIAFDGGLLIIIKLHGPEGTGFQALFTADAEFFIY
jgi:hypothetical protein